jgi:hypothetical protein
VFDTPLPEIVDTIARRAEVADEVVDRAQIVNGTPLVKYSATEAGLAALKAELAGKTYDLKTTKGDQAARADRLRCVTLRTTLEKRRKDFKAPALAYGKLIDTEAARITAEIEALEAPIDAQIKADEQRRAAEKAEKERIEREAQERHAARLQTIAGYLLRCQEVGMTAERIARGIQMLTDSDVSDTDAARAEALAGAKARALEQMGTLHAQAVAREAEAARQEAIRVENERRAAELAEQERRIAAEAAAIRRAAEELAAREAAARAAEAAAKQAENDRLAALDLKRAAELQAEFEASCAAATAREKAAQERYIEDRQADPIRADDPDAAPHTTAAEMGGDRADPGEAVGLAEVNPEPATVKESLTAEPTPADTLRALAAEARASRFPTNPKMGPEWWARWFAAVDALEVA